MPPKFASAWPRPGSVAAERRGRQVEPGVLSSVSEAFRPGRRDDAVVSRDHHCRVRQTPRLSPAGKRAPAP